MASNKWLISKIVELNKEAETEGLNNIQLTAMHKELQAATPQDEPSADDAEEKKAEEKALAKVKKIVVELPPFYIAEGKALTSKKGILGPGDEAKAEFFPRGQEAIDLFVKTGHILKA